MFVVCICVPVLSMCVYTHVCLYMLAVFVCVCVQPRAEAEMKAAGEEVLSNQKKSHEATRLKVVSRHISALTLPRMGRRKGWPVITPDCGSRYLQLDQIQNTLISSTMLLCVLGSGRGFHGLSIHTEQIMWGEALKPLPVEPSVCGAMGWPVEMMDVAMAKPGMVRLRSCRDGQRAEGERVTDCLLHWRLVPHTCEKENWDGPGPVLPQISPAASTRPP